MKAVGKLNHQHIVQAGDAGETDGMLYLAMQFVDGLDLSRLSARLDVIRVCDACEVVRQAAEGLECARQNGIVHRDVKPSNLILDRNGVVRVLDLGLALFDGKLDDQEGELTMDGQVMGTLGYMAPEQLDDSHLVTTRADVYGLGATLYRLLTGRTPLAVENHTTLQRLHALVSSAPTPIHDLRPDLPRELAATIDRMLARDQDQRLPTPGKVAEVLKPFTQGNDLVALLDQAASQSDENENSARATVDLKTLDTSSSQTSAPPASEQIHGRSNRHIAVSLAALLLVLVCASAPLWISRPAQREPSQSDSQPNAFDQREMIDWVFTIGGKPTIAMKSDPTQVLNPNTPEELPDESFEIVGIELYRVKLHPGDLGKVSRVPNLQYIGLAYTNVTDEELVHITDLPLHRLHLDSTAITTQGIRNLGNLGGLRAISLRATQIDDEAIEVICDRYWLQEMDLAETAITDACMRRLSEEPQLQLLNFEYTDVSDEGAKHLLKLKLLALNTFQTKVSDELNQQFEVLVESNRQPP